LCDKRHETFTIANLVEERAMPEAFICDAVRTPIGRYAGALAKVRTDDLAAVPLKALMARNPKIDWTKLDEVYFGCANQAAKTTATSPAWRSSSRAARQRTGRDAQPAVRLRPQRGRRGRAGDPCGRHRFRDRGRGGVDDPRALCPRQGQRSFSRAAEIYDTTIGWRFINPLMKKQYGVDAMPETGENVAEEFQVTRADQDAFAWRSQQRAGKAIAAGYFAEEIVPVEIAGKVPVRVETDEHPRPETTLEGLAKLKTPFRDPGTVTAAMRRA